MRKTDGMRKSLFQQFLSLFDARNFEMAAKFAKENLGPGIGRGDYSHRSGTFKMNQRKQRRANRRRAMKASARN